MIFALPFDPPVGGSGSKLILWHHAGTMPAFGIDFGDPSAAFWWMVWDWFWGCAPHAENTWKQFWGLVGWSVCAMVLPLPKYQNPSPPSILSNLSKPRHPRHQNLSPFDPRSLRIEPLASIQTLNLRPSYILCTFFWSFHLGGSSGRVSRPQLACLPYLRKSKGFCSTLDKFGRLWDTW